jgi:hypothetical protein
LIRLELEQAAQLSAVSSSAIGALLGGDCATPCASAATDGAKLPAPASVAALRKLRRPTSGEAWRFDMAVSCRSRGSNRSTKP